ncbi:CHAT domain-containing protein [Pseudonocardia lacus]|uniref:CHAT domain-containing protein n=1 Tax=Pseudonocardia lacus TaxID=2835865 RepID=UPI001BDBEF8F|nr:CHAT domain-containing protein [Pseudonocardia lacus]
MRSARWSRFTAHPTGLFTALPLHAAGSAPDRVVSSYTPTVASLLRGGDEAGEDGTRARMLGVAAATVPGQSVLPGATAELNELAARLPDDVRLTRLDDATRAEVAAALPDHGWANPACHAEQDLAQPSRAVSLLGDSRLDLTEASRGRGHRAAGAYLSACPSVLGGADLADEALNPAAAMQHAGYRRVIATLWPVGDRLARVAARSVYADLCRDRPFRPERSAGAVHDLMVELRRQTPRRSVAVGAVRSPRALTGPTAIGV